MVRVHMSVTQHNLLQRYDSFLNVRLDKTNRYYILFLLFYKDYFMQKIVNKLMVDGKKQKAICIFVESLMLLKTSIGFQPFFLFKHVAFKLRQIFKINTIVVRSQTIYSPVFLKSNKQVAYGVTNLISCAMKLRKDEHLTMAYALNVVLLNCFFKS